ncbi:MAG: ribosome recycling factor [bacterium]|nr:ribosome recycling factor [bacterium]MDD5756879.1 ribosome recycling factor [bacterium]
MNLNTVNAELLDKMNKALEKLKEEYSGIRTGRAHPSLLHDLKVEYYGNLVPIQQVASISVPEAKVLEIKPWDKSAMAEIKKAILKSTLGITPLDDGQIIRLVMPTPTEEGRKELVKRAHKFAEDKKVEVRNIRHQYNKVIEKMEKDKEVTEDEKFKGLEHVQKTTDEMIKKIDEVFLHKQKEIMEV